MLSLSFLILVPFLFYGCVYVSRFFIVAAVSNITDSNTKFSFLCYIKLLDVDPQDQGEEDGAVVDLDSQRKGKCAVIKTSTRQVINWQMYRNVVKLMKLAFCTHWHLSISPWSASLRLCSLMLLRHNCTEPEHSF